MREKTLGGLMRWEWIGLPILIAEVLIGRHGRQSPINYKY